jgi:Phosphotransferase enzyme family
LPFGAAANRVAVVNAATCNAKNTSGCGQSPAVVKVGKGTFVLALSAATGTIYGPNSGLSFNGTGHSGCGHLAATVKVGLGPFGVDVNDRTHTVYVANKRLRRLTGNGVVINGATCNGTDTSGCNGHIRTVPVGRSPLLVVADARTDIIYVTDFSNAAVSVLNGSKRNAAVTSACGRSMHQRAVGSLPFGLAVNQRTNTVYVTQTFQSGPCRSSGASASGTGADGCRTAAVSSAASRPGSLVRAWRQATNEPACGSEPPLPVGSTSRVRRAGPRQLMGESPWPGDYRAAAGGWDGPFGWSGAGRRHGPPPGGTVVGCDPRAAASSGAGGIRGRAPLSRQRRAGPRGFSYIEGQVPLLPYPAWSMTDTALTDLGGLLRRLHQATVSLDLTGISGWSQEWADPLGGPVICHNDVFPENAVFPDGRVSALIDFAVAAPGRAFWDVAIAAQERAPLHAPAARLDHPRHLDGVARLGLMARAYGVRPDDAPELVDVIFAERAQSVGHIRSQVAAGDPVWVGHWQQTVR